VHSLRMYDDIYQSIHSEIKLLRTTWFWTVILLEYEGL